MYGADLNQKDWDEYVERLTFALNTTYDRISPRAYPILLCTGSVFYVKESTQCKFKNFKAR
ncbi:hypothetical protein L914_02338 [Phytophthora nicotianae]|uniref:Uncharacterized protein n=1 Tax=Phytophthora nicotianae TaxID=4792 RepID=W2P331_PHYNI|nr:hypothetical protein L914_02338 [Phytophthora nicotianae]